MELFPINMNFIVNVAGNDTLAMRLNRKLKEKLIVIWSLFLYIITKTQFFFLLHFHIVDPFHTLDIVPFYMRIFIYVM